MPTRPLDSKTLWTMPRVGSPEPSPDGSALIVPVTKYSLDSNAGNARLWHIPLAQSGKGVKAGRPRPLTDAEHSCGQARWSPDGGHILFTRKPGGKADPTGKGGPRFPDQAQLYRLDLAGGEAERLTDLPFGVSAPRWFPDGRRIAFISYVYSDAMSMAKTTGLAPEREEAPVKAVVTENRIYRFWDHWLAEGKVQHLFVLDLEDGRLTDLTPRNRLILELSATEGDFDIAPDGREIAFAACASRPPYSPFRWGLFTVALPAGGAKGGAAPVREITRGDKGHAAHPVYSPDGRWILYSRQEQVDFYADRMRLVAHDRRSSKQHVLTEDWDRSAMDYAFAPGGKSVIVLAETEARTAFFSLDFAKALRGAGGKTAMPPPKELRRGGTFGAPRLAGKRIFASLSTLRAAPEVYCLDLDGKELSRLSRFTAKSMAAVKLSEVKELEFVGAEGRRVQMFLLFPPGVRGRTGRSSGARRSPLVHMIHGGPHGVFGDQWHWRWSAQAFAAPGYLVALVNFHGSTSWGQDFTASILGHWGDQPYADIMAATDLLVERGIADPQRMAVTGGSYGGYLVSWIAAKTKRFACIVNHAGVCDLQSQYASDWTQGRRRSMGGEPWDNVEGLDRYNPMREAKGFHSPMLVLHGERDYRVPYSQGLEIYNVYKAMGLPARLVVYPDENHWILKPQNSIHWYGEVLDWLSRWLVGGAKRKHRERSRGSKP